jgi:cell division septation protein DedD
MYCPNCEFEIKQEVTECPICGGALTQHPGETPAAQPGGQQTGDTPFDVSISNLILDAKHELDALDSQPGPASYSDEQPAESLNLEALLSQDPDENPFQFPDAPSEPAMADMPPAQSSGQDMFAQPDNNLFRETAGSPFFEAEPAADPYPFAEETAVPGQPFILDDSLFIDETAPRDAPQDSAPFIDEAGGQRLSNALDSMPSPPQRPGVGAGLTFGQDTTESSTGGLDFMAETPQQSQAAPETFNISDSEAPQFSLDPFAEAPQAGPRGSKIRLIALALFGVVIIAGAYVLGDYFLQQPEPAEQIAKPAAPAVRKKRKPPVQKPATELPAPAVSTEQSTPPAETGLPQQAATPDTPRVDTVAQQAAENPAAEPQPVPPAPERIRTATAAAAAAAKPEQQKTTEPQQKVERAAASADSAPAMPSLDKKPAPAQGAFSVHVFSFKTQQSAQAEIDRLNKRGFNAYLETVDLGAKGIWHRVKVGNYATRAEAEQARLDIKKKYPGIEPLLNINR